MHMANGRMHAIWHSAIVSGAEVHALYRTHVVSYQVQRKALHYEQELQKGHKLPRLTHAYDAVHAV